jgi:DNA-binding transcriptional LysR family regulator
MSNSFNELEAAKAFIQVVRSGSFAAAAKLRDENPSSVSRAVAHLEEHLQVRLLNRTTRSVALTEAGGVYLEHAQQMLQTQSSAREALALLTTGKPRGLVKISMPVVLGEQVLLNHMERFRKAYPEIELHFDLSNRNALLVEEGIDIALRFGELADSSLRAQRLITIYRKVYASHAYLERHGRPLTPADLVNHHTLSYAQRGAFLSWDFWSSKTGKKHEPIPIKSWFSCSSATMILQMMGQGLGIGRSAEWMVNNSEFKNDLVEVLSDWRCEDPKRGGVPLFLVYPPGPANSIPQKVRVVSDFIRQVLESDFVKVKLA